MKNDTLQTLNYCAHAIDDLRATEMRLRTAAPLSAYALRSIIGMLQRSVKFILPNCCDLIDSEELKQTRLDLMRLPFPCVAFEAPWEHEHDGPQYIGEFQQSKATKRIALCWEADLADDPLPGLNAVFESFPEGGIFLVPIYWVPQFGRWVVAMGGNFIPFKNELAQVSVERAPPATRLAHAAKMEAGLATGKGGQFRAEPFTLLPELFAQAVATYGSEEKAFAQIILDAHDETMVLLQACSVLNCANVTTVDLVPPAALNKKRQARDKEPFFTYKVLQLTEERKAAGSGTGGTHASARMHLRRGHLRRLESRAVWVRPTTVNAGSKLGSVHKDYAMPSRQ